MSDSTGEGGRPARGILVVLTGPSGVGKGSVMAQVRQILAADSDNIRRLWLSVSATTRRPRPGEVDGEHYFFVSPDQFDEMIGRNQLLEWAEFAGNRYGTPRTAVLEHVSAGEAVLLEIDLDGARQVKAELPEAFMVFLAPPSREELRRRLVGRGTESADAIALRLATSEVELAAADEFDEVVVNEDVSEAAARLVDLIVGRRS